MSPVSGTGTFISQSWNTLESPYDKWEEQKHQTIPFFWSLHLTEMSFAHFIFPEYVHIGSNKYKMCYTFISLGRYAKKNFDLYEP